MPIKRYEIAEAGFCCEYVQQVVSARPSLTSNWYLWYLCSFISILRGSRLK